MPKESAATPKQVVAKKPIKVVKPTKKESPIEEKNASGTQIAKK
jgi:hypothetical protein